MQGATFEARIAGGVHLYDASGSLDRRDGGWPARRSLVRRVYLHHSGRLGRTGLEGLRNSARYTVRSRGWKGCPYHYWLPYEPVRDGSRALVVYRAQPDDRHSWHTGGRANAHGIGVCLQGALGTRGPSDFQVELLEALVPWLLLEQHWETMATDRPLSWHSESGEWGGSGKATCPGEPVEQWARTWRAGWRSA